MFKKSLSLSEESNLIVPFSLYYLRYINHEPLTINHNCPLTSKHPSHTHLMGLKGRCTGRLTDVRVIHLPSHYPPFLGLNPHLSCKWECPTFGVHFTLKK